MEMIGLSRYLRLAEYQGQGLKVKDPRLILEESKPGFSASVQYSSHLAMAVNWLDSDGQCCAKCISTNKWTMGDLQ